VSSMWLPCLLRLTDDSAVALRLEGQASSDGFVKLGFQEPAILILIFNRFGLPAASHGGYATRLFPHERWRV
jgi:hypothetical protein